MRILPRIVSSETTDGKQKSLRERMRQFYESSETYRGFLDAHDAVYLQTYVDLVIQHAQPGDRILDMGCGNGLSTYLMAERGFQVVGTDISSLFLQDARPHPNVVYRVSDAHEMPFADESFEVVCSNELIEHVPDVENVLHEMIRLTVPGGRIIISGPNLCSPIMPLLDLLQLLRGKQGRPIWAETRRHALVMAWRNFAISFRKRFSRQANFLYRDPDLEDRVIGGDADSVYLASPIDLERYFTRHGCRILKLAVGFGSKGRLLAKGVPRLSPYISMVVQRQ